MVLLCQDCGTISKYSNNLDCCHFCGNHIFKIALKNYPITFKHPDREEQNPYKPRSSDPNADYLKRLMTPGDEEYSGGFGTRARDGFPRGISERDDYEEQRGKSIPGSMDDFISNPPTSGQFQDHQREVIETFTDPIDPLSRANRVNREMGMGYPDQGSLSDRLDLSRLKPVFDDETRDPFTVTRKKRKA